MAREGAKAALRGMWSGTISFGLVSVPVSLFPALRARPIRLRMLSEAGTPLRREYVCPKHGRPLERDEIVRGYELEDGGVVLVEDEELEALAPEKSNDIALKEFVELDQIPRFHFDRPYFLAPGGGSYRAYRLLAHVMAKRRRAGIATFVMRGKEYLVAIVSREGLLMAETMRFADELRSPAELDLPEAKGAKRALVESMSRAISARKRKTLDESALEDHYARGLQALIARKKRSRKRVVRAEVDDEEPRGELIDLVALFKERMREAEEGGGGDELAESLEELSRDELYERAKAMGIPNRSKMSKKELAEAISA